MIKSINTLGKFLDQPVLISKLNKAMPAIVSTGMAGYLAKDIFEQRNKGKLTKKTKAGFHRKSKRYGIFNYERICRTKNCFKNYGESNLRAI